ncbi:MAG: ATP-binding protein [Saprospiraceae bacterium]|nr:ATP-binding protein [Saprospiraceae bacterium]
MIKRFVANDVLESLAQFPAVGIIGPRQVGKTTLSKQLIPQIARPSLFLDLELTEDVNRLQNAQFYLQSHQDKCVIIDEIQLMPQLFPLLRALIDQNRVSARFLILGSASPALIRQNSETLAGRIAYTELTPLSLTEITDSKIPQEKHWLFGGFPDALLASSEKIAIKWLVNFLSTFLEKDLRALGYEISTKTLSKLYRMIAHIHGQLLNINMLSQSIGVSNPTIGKYLDLIEGGFLIRRLEPFHINIGKRLVKSPKIYYRDTGILHQLLSIPNFEALMGHNIVGASWEGYVIEQIDRAVQGRWQFYFYRTHAGAETDLVLISPNGKMTCVEIKFSFAPALKKGFYQSIADLKPDFQYVIIPSGSSYFLNKDLKVCSLLDFLQSELPIIAA